MKIIAPKAELIDEINPAEVLAKIERCGRVSHLSQPYKFATEPYSNLARQNAICGKEQAEPYKNAEKPYNTTENFVRMLIKRGHESVLEHVSLTFHIICDRAIMAELTRHRLASFTVESTRYIKYDELTFVKPCSWDEKEPSDTYELLTVTEDDTTFVKRPNKFNAWLQTMQGICSVYEFLIAGDAKPEDARAILPLCLKSELYMTANLREWRHILKLRTSKAAHPQMREIMRQILAVFKQKLPVIVEDIAVEEE